MTHEPGSKMASKHACIILHIPVSAYAVLLNIPRRWLCCWGGAGKGQRSSSPEGPKFVLASLPGGLTQPSTCSGQAPASVQPVPLHGFVLGLLSLENVSVFSVLYWRVFLVFWVVLVLFCYESHSCSKKAGALWGHSEYIPRTSWTREVWGRAKLWKKSHMKL